MSENPPETSESVHVDVEALDNVLAAPAEDFKRDYLEIRGLRVVFDGFVAVDGVDLTVTSGDLRFLIGPNGAGKTTMVDAVTGLAPATGSVRFGGVELLGKSSHRIARAGVGRTFQTASVFEELTVLQNLDIAAGSGRGLKTLLRKRSAVPAEVEAALETIGLTRVAQVRPGCWHTGRSSGWRSACCWCRTRTCCCWTSRWPG